MSIRMITGFRTENDDKAYDLVQEVIEDLHKALEASVAFQTLKDGLLERVLGRVKPLPESFVGPQGDLQYYHLLSEITTKTFIQAAAIQWSWEGDITLALNKDAQP